MVSRIEHSPFSHSLSMPPSKKDLIKTVALRSLTEFVITLAIGIAVASFIASPPTAILFLSLLATQFIVNTLFRIVGAYSLHKCHQNKTNREIYSPLVLASDVVPVATFTLISGTNLQTLIHESGHALAAKALFQTDPKIDIVPFKGGMTQFSPSKLTALGKKIGKIGAAIIVTALGAGFSLFISSILLTLGLALRKKHETLSNYLIAYGTLDFVSHIVYAISAYSTSPQNLSHDFVHLAKYGHPPIAAALGLATVPLLIAINSVAR